MRIVLIALFLLSSCAHHKNGEVTLIKQWHLSAKTVTTNISESKKLPQFQNQKYIYDYLAKKAKKNQMLILSEGCQRGSLIDENFQTKFNGHDYQTLRTHHQKENYSDILTLLPLKLAAKFPDQVRAECADDDKLIHGTQLALSDARGFIGFYLRLKQSKNDQKKFLKYKEALEETQDLKIDDPILYSKTKVIESLDHFKYYMNLRNKEFIKSIKKNLHNNPILIVGGLHVNEIASELKAQGIKVKTITPEGYPIKNEKLADELIEQLGP